MTNARRYQHEQSDMQIPAPQKTDSERKHLREHFLEPEVRCGTEISVHTKKVWKCMLDMLEQLDCICRKHGIRYHVTSGTLLGAIRHGGFIPWDEDLDVAMPRRDFNRFLEIAQADLPEPMFLQTWSTDRDVASPFARIRNRKTAAIVESYAAHHWLCDMGIFVDIYPLDGIPDGKLARRFNRWVVHNLIRTHGQSMNPPKNPPLTRKDHVRRAFYRLVGERRLWRMLNSFVALFPFEHCLMCGLTPYSFKPGPWQNSRCPSRWFEECEERDFEYLKVMVPVQYSRILGAYYGNWTEFVKGEVNHDGTIYTDIDHPSRMVLPERYAHYGYTADDFADPVADSRKGD